MRAALRGVLDRNIATVSPVRPFFGFEVEEILRLHLKGALKSKHDSITDGIQIIAEISPRRFSDALFGRERDANQPFADKPSNWINGQ
jgi:hypothetical protein